MSPLFKIIKSLEGARVHFYIERTRQDSVSLNITIPGERIEIDIFEDDHIEISRFRGDESVESLDMGDGKEELLVKFISSLSD